MEDVVVVTMSEFGRTAKENGNRGTDHGHANAMFVMGGAVKGGKVYGKWPGLAQEQLYEERDLALTTDFRDVLSEAVYRHLGNRSLQTGISRLRRRAAKIQRLFERVSISAAFARRCFEGNIWHCKCPMPPEETFYARVAFSGDGNIGHVGNMASAQVFERRATMRGGGNAGEGKCTVEVVVDGAAQVEIRGDLAVLRNLSGQQPQWRRFECNAVLPPNPAGFRFRGIDGRGRQQLIREPRGGSSAVIQIEDPDNGSEGYTFDIMWSGQGGPYTDRGQVLIETAEDRVIGDSPRIRRFKSPGRSAQAGAGSISHGRDRFPPNQHR